MVEKADKNQDAVLDEAVEQFLAARLRGEEPDLEKFVRQYPGLEKRIKQKVQNCERVSSLFDSLREVDESEFQHTKEEADLIGKLIGAFKITEVIGRGGMGVVYKGHDSRLDRFVAIKSMPAELQADSTARKRFTREAKLLASLNHPNIAVIHDIIEQDEGTSYLVLEHIPGQTLAERISGKPLKLEDALSIGLQVAEAVSAAHEEGVVHRDLKPGNIKVTPDGRVKVLDFGLAKTSVSRSATSEPTVTQAGRVIGTPAYMSPEQARGKATDRRTDIWSFGCVLYEMLTGKVPFEGETTTDTIARIIEREPDWDRLPTTTPPNIRVLLRRCLAKEPLRRLQHIGDAALEIDETLSLPAVEPPITAPMVGKVRLIPWRLTIICSVAGIVVGLVAASIFISRPTPPSLTTVAAVPTGRTVIRLPENQVLGFYQAPFANRQPVFALSPDGSRLVYAARVGDSTQLFERLMDRYEVRPIPGTDGASSPFFSPDGQSVGFFAEEVLKVVSLLGGEPVTLCSARDRSGGSWGDDGLIYFVGGGGLSRVSATGGNVEPMGTESKLISGAYPQVLPGGKAVLISSGDGAVLVSLETIEKKVLVKDVRYARYVPTGHLVYARAGAIEAVPFSMATLEVTGPPIPVLEQVLLDSVSGTAQFDFSNNGLLVYAPGADIGRSIPAWIDRQGKVEPLPMPEQIYGTFRLSPDGKRLAILVRELQSNVYIYDIARGTGTRLTVEGDNYYPLWTPDGERIVFSRRREADEQWDILWAPADGSGEAELLCSSKSRLAPGSLSSNGKLLALYRGNRDIWILPLEGQRELELLLGTEFLEVCPEFSPDGQWIAYMSDRDGKMQVYVRPYPAMNRVWQISYDLGEEPIWSPNGDELFYRSVDNKWMVVSISTEPEFDHGTPQVLFEGPYNNVSGVSYDVAPDGQRFLVLQPQYDDSQVRELHVVTNWFEELKRLVPTGKDL
jgi:serine/threonine protein kinase/Tol biopolymer transport system component